MHQLILFRIANFCVCGCVCSDPDASVDPAEGRVLPGEAALQRLQRNDQQQHHTESPVPHKKPCSVPKLVTMATRAAISLTSGQKHTNVINAFLF